MRFLEIIRAYLVPMPMLARAALALAIIVGVPRLSQKLKIPGAVGLLLSGVLFGPHLLGVAPEHHPVGDFLAQIGKLLLLFCAGLEVNLTVFQTARNRMLCFGLLTTMIPLVLGTIVGVSFGYEFLPAVVIGSLLASHTLLGLPTISRLRENGLEPVAVTVGATVISDTLSLVVFAICVSTFQTGFSTLSLSLQLIEIAIFVPFILFGVSRMGAWLLKKVERDEQAYFIVMLGILITAGSLANLINLPGIVGAFLAGLAVNAATHDKPAKEKLQFFGDSLFIPIFFIVTGFLIDPVTFLDSITGSFALVAAVLLALLIGKGAAAEIAGRTFGYSRAARATVWSLSLPQVAATLAAALVGYDTLNPAGQRLLDARMLNVVFVLMLTTAILGPVLTERFAPRMLSKASTKPSAKIIHG